MLPAVLEQAARHVAAQQQTVSDEVWVRLRQAGYPENSAPLSQRALHVLLGLEGVSAVLVGMRRLEYVADALAAADLAPLDSLSILEHFRSVNTAELAGSRHGTN